MLFKPGHRPAHGGSRELQLLSRSRQRARLCDRDKRAYIVEIEVIHERRFLFPAAQGQQ
jgi:hypothetical protein